MLRAYSNKFGDLINRIVANAKLHQTPVNQAFQHTYCKVVISIYLFELAFPEDFIKCRRRLF